MERYRPARSGVILGAIAYILLYGLFFGFILEFGGRQLDAAGFFQRLAQALPPLEPLILPVGRIVSQYFSWPALRGILRHAVIPGFFGWVLAIGVTIRFLRHFYELSGLGAAAGFLGDLFVHSLPPAFHPRIWPRPEMPDIVRRAGIMTAIFWLLSLFVILLHALRWPTQAIADFYRPLVILLIVLWLVALGTYALFILFFTRPRLTPITLENLETLQQEDVLCRVGGPGRIIIPNSNEAVITEYNGRFRRVLGPGMRRLGPFEYIKTMIDLQQQDRDGVAIVITRDGIEAEIAVSVTFRVGYDDTVMEVPAFLDAEDPQEGPPATRPTPGNLYPYGDRAAKEAAYTNTVLADGVNDWTRLPLTFARANLRNAVAERRLDDLLSTDGDEGEAYAALQTEVIRRTRDRLRGMGIYLIGARFGQIELPDPVEEQHLETWRAFWERQGQISRAEGRAEAIQETELADLDAETAMLRAILEGVQRARQRNGADITRYIVALRLIETLEKMARRQSELLALPAGDILLRRLQELQEQLMEEQGRNRRV